MNILKIYNIIAVVIIILLTIYTYSLQQELVEKETALIQTEAILRQCESRYFELVN